MDSSPTPESTDAVVVNDVVRVYGDNRVLDGIDLRVTPGEKLTIIGPSGSGKSTLLRLIMGLERPDGGDVRVLGRSVFRSPNGGEATDAEVREAVRPVGMVFQRFHVFPHMTALENVTLGPRRVRGMDREAANALGRETLERVGLDDKVDAYPSSLSGGQQQRVAIARALAMEPRVLLFDEITSALDPELVGEVLAIVRALAKETDVTMMLVTHQMGFARAFSDRIAVTDGGKILETGPPEQIFDAPQHERTERFLRSVLDANG
jgi:polar amino acid transport system ATP-binding protein